MTSIKVKISGIIIIVSTLVLFFGTILVTTIEYLRISEYLVNEWEGNRSYTNQLVDDGYYNNDNIKFDPYSSYTVQHLHPYYMFSLPWRTDDQTQLKNSIVTINSDGFRNNPSNVSQRRRTAIILGGSTAFGHFSSSDETTIAAVLARKLEINVVNRNAPSWNSHQELVALAKYFDEYQLSISFTLANDISLACLQNNRWDDGLTYLDSPESFITLQSKINNIREDIASNLSLNLLLKGFAKSVFPDTYKLLWLVKNYFITEPNQSPNETHNFRFCSNVEPQDVALSFLQNQNTMNKLSTARNARHVVVLQPLISLIDSHAIDHAFRNSVYDIVMESEYCANNICVDTRVTQNPITKDDLYNGNNIEKALFVDNVHLTDNGVLFYSQILIDRLIEF
jgi:hypothetical protein